MSDSARFAYVQARVQARYAARPTASEWRLLEASADAGHFLQAARTTSLAPWVAHLTTEATPEIVERGFRLTWHEMTGRTAGWPDARWSPAVRWLGWLPWLPALDQLAMGGSLRAWMREDTMLGHPSASARLPEGLADASEPVRAWRTSWLRLLPDHGEWLDALSACIDNHRDAMQSGDEDGQVLRLAVSARLERLFRRCSGGPGALFAWLLLAGLDAERLRFGLLRLLLVKDPARIELWA